MTTYPNPDALAQIDENRRALEDRWERWQPRTTAQVLDLVAARHAERPYVLTEDRSYSYHDIARWSVRLAAGLSALGVRPGDHVAVDMANFPEAIALKFAVARLGAVSVSINFLLRHEELGYVLAQSRARVLITMDRFRDLDYLEALDKLAPGWETQGGGAGLPDLRDIFVFATDGGLPSRGRSLRELEDLGLPVSDETVMHLTEAVDPESTSDLLYTSGTTGKAKGVMLRHDAVLRMAYGSAYARGFDDGYRIMFAMPIYHVFGYVEGTIAVLFVAGAVCPRTTFDAQKMLELVRPHHITEIMAVPAMTSPLLAEAKRGSYDLAPLRTMFSSGAAHAPQLWTDMLDLLGVQHLFTAYGQTETTASTTLTQAGDPLDRFLTTNGCMKHSGIAGYPELGGTLATYRVVSSETGEELPPGEVGGLQVKGPVLTHGYFDKPAETAALFTADGWMVTGDLGRIDADGYLTLTGRTKESYRCGGELVIPSDAEEVLTQHPMVAAAHVVGIPDERMGEVGCAWVIPAPGARPSADDLIAHCRERIARFKVPAFVLFTSADELPLTVTGRVQKFHLAQRAVRTLAADAKGRTAH